nr:MAG TPA: hypothetical protein [Caudoviricetes sp.]
MQNQYRLLFARPSERAFFIPNHFNKYKNDDHAFICRHSFSRQLGGNHSDEKGRRMIFCVGISGHNNDGIEQTLPGC